MTRRTPWRRLAFPFVGLLVTVLTACSILLDSDQCKTDGDCQKKGAGFAEAVCASGLCSRLSTMPDADSGTECKANVACGASSICKKSTGHCVSLLSEDCVKIVGDYTSDDAVVIGSVLKIVGSDLGGSPSIAAGIELARDEIMEVARGLPINGGTPRPLVVVECDQVVDPVRAAHHLTDTIGVPAILGTSNSGTTTAVATEVTIPAKVLLMSPTATSPTITDLQDDGLVWRASPPDTLQGKVIALAYPTLEQRVLKDASGLEGHVRVALAAKGDTYGKGLREVVLTSLQINGGPAAAQDGSNFRSREYPNTDGDPNFDFTSLVTELSDFKPHVVIIAGTSEGVRIILGLEERLGPADPRPYYLLSDGLVNPDLPTAIDALDATAAASLRSRSLGVIPGNPKAPNFVNFSLRLDSKFGNGAFDLTNASFGYDSLYLVAYAIVASQMVSLTGPSIADGLDKITGKSGVVVSFEPNQINTAMKLLLRQQTVNVDGASGPLDFDQATGDPVADIDVQSLCPLGGKTLWTSSGLAFDAANDKLTGAVGPCP